MNVKDLAKQAYQDKLDRERQWKEERDREIEQEQRQEYSLSLQKIEKDFGEDILFFLEKNDLVKRDGFLKKITISEELSVYLNETEQPTPLSIEEGVWEVCHKESSYCIETRQKLLEILGQYCPHCQD